MKKSNRKNVVSEKVPVSVYITRDLLERVDAEVEADGHRTQSQMIAKLLDEALDAREAAARLATA